MVIMTEGKKAIVEKLIEAVMNKDKKSADAALARYVNNRVAGKIRKVQNSEDLV